MGGDEDLSDPEVPEDDDLVLLEEDEDELEKDGLTNLSYELWVVEDPTWD